MESKLEQGTLTVALPPRINSDNAGEVERELFALVEQSGPKAVVLDAAARTTSPQRACGSSSS